MSPLDRRFLIWGREAHARGISVRNNLMTMAPGLPGMTYSVEFSHKMKNESAKLAGVGLKVSFAHAHLPLPVVDELIADRPPIEILSIKPTDSQSSAWVRKRTFEGIPELDDLGSLHLTFHKIDHIERLATNDEGIRGIQGPALFRFGNVGTFPLDVMLSACPDEKDWEEYRDP